jgi:hypothetical protein
MTDAAGEESTPTPTPIKVEPRHRTTLLDTMLDSVFGRSFSPVLEFESHRIFGMDLQGAMMKDPSEAYHLLRRVFVLEEAVDLLLANVSGKAAQLGASQEYLDLRLLLAKVLESRPVPANTNHHVTSIPTA